MEVYACLSVCLVFGLAEMLWIYHGPAAPAPLGLAWAWREAR